MPATSTIPNGLKQLLSKFGVTLAGLSRHTGISRARLIRLFEAGDFTQAELRSLVDPLSADFARAFISSAQKGQFNQAGAGNRQRVKVIHNVNVSYNVVINISITKGPEPSPLSNSPYHRGTKLVVPGGQVLQLGQHSSVSELDRAA